MVSGYGLEDKKRRLKERGGGFEGPVLMFLQVKTLSSPGELASNWGSSFDSYSVLMAPK